MGAETLLSKLADGELHSGQALARELGITRAAVWKQMDKLRDWGLEVETQRGRGYRLGRRLDLIDIGRLRASLGDVFPAGRIELHTTLESTNRHLLRSAPPAEATLDACIAEYQSQGRGRRGRRWHAPLGACLCLSVAWTFTRMPPNLTALSLAVGALVRDVLAGLTGTAPELKWPNDLVFADAKLGGILVELAAEAQGRCHIVAGIGINVHMPDELLASVSDWPAGAVDLHRLSGGAPPPRTELAARLIASLGEMFARYAATGFAPYRDSWRSGDYLRGKQVSLDDGLEGRALGIDDDGALLIEVAGGARHRAIAGDVSVRPRP